MTELLGMTPEEARLCAREAGVEQVELCVTAAPRAQDRAGRLRVVRARREGAILRLWCARFWDAVDTEDAP